MSEKVRYIEDILNKIDGIYILLCQGDKKEGFEKLNDMMNELTNILGEILNSKEIFSKLEVEFPEEIVIQQINNLADAIEHKDTILLTDTLNYEIKNTLLFYIDVINELEKNNIMV